MRARPGFISDLAQVANGAASAFGSMREEIENIVSARTERAPVSYTHLTLPTKA